MRRFCGSRTPGAVGTRFVFVEKGIDAVARWALVADIGDEAMRSLLNALVCVPRDPSGSDDERIGRRLVRRLASSIAARNKVSGVGGAAKTRFMNQRLGCAARLPTSGNRGCGS